MVSRVRPHFLNFLRNGEIMAMAIKKSDDLKDPLVWIDLEMTGLNPEKEHILEIATLITDGALERIIEGPNLIIYQPPSVLDNMEKWSMKQHGKTGLTDQVKKSRISLKSAEQETLRFMRRYCTPSTAPLCGNAVHHDRRFLIKYMPSVHEYLHYRHVDVSTLKALVKRWYPKLKGYSKKSDRHRALDDIRESIEELKFYREHFFKESPVLDKKPRINV
jgi:oligoribonuclease